MSFSSDYNKLRKKRLNIAEEDTSNKSFSEQYAEARQMSEKTNIPVLPLLTAQDDIAPIRTTTRGGGGSFDTEAEKKEEKKKTWFKASAFDDGYQFGDIAKTILATGQDVSENVFTGILGMGEKAVDAGAYIVGGVGGIFGADEFQDKTKEFIAKDLYDEKKLAKSMTKHTVANLFADTDEDSLLGDKADSVVQSAGQLLGTSALQAAGVPWFLTTGVTSFGGEVENAFNEGASYGESGGSALISAGAEMLSEKLFGGIKFGGKTLDDVLLKPLTSKISSKVARTLTNLGIDAVGEGTEEVVSSVFSRLGSALYKEESIDELLTSEEAMDEYIESFIGGLALGGGLGSFNAAKHIKTGRDYKTGLTTNEQSVVDKEVENRVAEEEKDGKTLSKKDKNKIYDEVLSDLKKGYISTDTIEEVLGGETYKSYKDTADNEDSILKEYEELGKKQNATLAEQTRYAELSEMVKDIKANSKRNQIKTQLGENVLGLATKGKDNFLLESYNEKTRKSQAFEADLSKYDTKQQAVIKKAVESGILNNTNRTHEFVDMVAKISADKGVPFDFTNNTRLKESGLAIEGKTVNGYVTKDGIVVNIDSSKSMNSIVGHEIAHVLEGTELYTELQNALFEYAKSQNDYQNRYDTLSKLYEGIEGSDINAELTADLVGDYLFTDSGFISELSAQHRNIFQKIYDEIKYLCKVATAGSKEARQIERVKRAFDKAYKENIQQKNTADGGAQYDIAALENGNVYVRASRKVINGATRAEQRRNITDFFSELLQDKSSLDIHTIEGDILTITKAETSKKARDDYKTVGGNPIKMTDKEFSVKLNVEAHIDEVAEVSTKIGKSSDNKNHDFAQDGFTYRRTYFEDFDGEYYEITLSIGHNGTVATVYNVGKIKESIPPSAKIIAVVGSKPLGGTPSNDSIPQNSQKSSDNVNLSLFKTDEQYAPIGAYNVYGKDIALETTPAQEVLPNDIAPVRKDIGSSVKEPVEDIAPMPANNVSSEGDVNKAAESTKDENKVNLQSTKLQAIQTEIEENRRLREESYSAYEQKLSELQTKYDSKQNKNTKTANDLLRSIERTRRLRDSVDADYANRINGLESNEKRIREGKPTSMQEHHNGIIDAVKTTFAEKGFNLDDVLQSAKNLSTLKTVDNTPQRVMEKALGYKEGQILADITVNKVAQNETEGIKWLNSFTNRKNGILARLSEQYHIKPGSKESAAAQMYAEGFYVDDKNRIVA